MILGRGLIWSILIASTLADIELSKDLHVRTRQIHLKCGKENNFKEKDYYQVSHDVPLTEDEIKRYHCFVKCYFQTDGTIDKKGFVNYKKLNESLSTLKFDKEEKKKIIACYKKAEPVIKCSDVASVMRCIPREED